jgi:hypothetical protein
MMTKWITPLLYFRWFHSQFDGPQHVRGFEDCDTAFFPLIWLLKAASVSWGSIMKAEWKNRLTADPVPWLYHRLEIGKPTKF